MTPSPLRHLTTAGLVIVGLAYAAAPGFAQQPDVSQRNSRAIERRVVIVDGDDDSQHTFAYSTGRGAFLGISMLELTPGLRRHFDVEDDSGVMISDVETDSPAALAGLEAGDILLSVDGARVARGHDVASAIRPHEEGDSVELEVLRDGQILTFSAALTERERQNIDVGAWAWNSDGSDRPLMFQLHCADDENCPEEMMIGSEMFEDALSTLQERVQSPDFQQRIMEFHSGNEALEKRLEELEEQLAELQEQLDRLN